jgi:hypothetical protein
MQFSWDAQDLSGRINIVLSEQLVGRNSVGGELDLGVANAIVRFSFQHAPKGERACRLRCSNLICNRHTRESRNLVANT